MTTAEICMDAMSAASIALNLFCVFLRSDGRQFRRVLAQRDREENWRADLTLGLPIGPPPNCDTGGWKTRGV